MMNVVRIFSLACVLSAQTPEPGGAVIRQAGDAWNAFAALANDWSAQHNEFISSRADSERLEKTRRAWAKFDRLSREAKL